MDEQDSDVRRLQSEVHGILQQELTTSESEFRGSTHRVSALNYYNGVETANTDEGFRQPDGSYKRSVVNSGVIYDQVNAALDQMWPTLKSEMIAEFEPTTEQDEQNAQNESLAVHHVVMKQNQGAIAMVEAAHDALLLRNGVFRVWVDDRLETKLETHENVPSMGLAQMMQEAEQTADSDDALEILDVQPTGQQEPIIDPMSGQWLGVEEYFTVETKRWTRKPQLRVEAWPVESFRVKGTTRNQDLQDCEFCAFLWEMSRGAAKDRGFPPDLVDRTISTHSNQMSQTEQARSRGATEMRDWGTNPDNETIAIWECYWRGDIDGDGQFELNKVYLGGWTGDVWYSHERAGYIPAALGVTRIYPHRLEGDSFYDSHRHIHDSKRGILRAWNNSLAAALQGGKMYNVAMFDDPDDIYQQEIERVMRVTGDVRAAMASEPWNDVSPAATAALAYWDKLSAERGGGGTDMISEAVPVGGSTAHGTERRESSKELPMERSLGTFMQTAVVSLWKLVHHVLRNEFGAPISFRRPNGVWINEDPARWSPRESVNIVSGLTLGERLRRSSFLSQEIETQMGLMEQGSLLVDETGLHTALIARAHANGLTGAASWWVDPSSPQGKQAQQQRQQQQQEQQQKAEEERQVTLKLQTALGEAEFFKGQAALEKQKAEQLQVFIDAAGDSVEQQQKQRELDIKEMDSTIDAAVKIGELGLEAEKVEQDAGKLVDN